MFRLYLWGKIKYMKKLKVGDKLYHAEESRWSGNVIYRFATVVRLTNTQAILSNGGKLINEPTKSHYDETYGYPIYGDRWNKWHIETEEIIQKAKAEKERQAIINWFDKRKFTEEDKRIIYDKFKELDILTPKETNT